MLSVVREHIIQEAQSSDLLSIQADETADITTPLCQTPEEHGFSPHQGAHPAVPAGHRRSEILSIPWLTKAVKLVLNRRGGGHSVQRSMNGLQQKSVIPYSDTHWNGSPPQTTSSVPPCCKQTGLISIKWCFLKLHGAGLDGSKSLVSSTARVQSLSWCFGPTPAVYGEQS